MPALPQGDSGAKPDARMMTLQHCGSAPATAGSELARIREEFRRCTGSLQVPLTAETLALHWQRLAEQELTRETCNIGVRTDLSESQKHLIALRVAQAMWEMDLKRQGCVQAPEWVHHALCQKQCAKTPVGRLVGEISNRLRLLLHSKPDALAELQWAFESVDMLGDRSGRLTLPAVVEACKLRIWTEQRLKWLFDLLPLEIATLNTHSEIAAGLFDCLDLDNDGRVNYVEFLAAYFGRKKAKVTLHFYDISGGYAQSWSPWLLGQNLEGVWHTGISVQGREYYYGGGVAYHKPGCSSFGKPQKEVCLGFTLREQFEWEQYISMELKPRFTPERYDVLSQNCNHFTDAVCMHLLGKHIPDEVLMQPENVVNTKLGSAAQILLNGWLGNVAPETAESNTGVRRSKSSPPTPSGPRCSVSTPARKDAVMIRKTSSGTGPGDVLGHVVDPRASKDGTVLVKFFKVPGEGAGAGRVQEERYEDRRVTAVAAISCGGGRAITNYLAAVRAMKGVPSPTFSWTTPITGSWWGGTTRRSGSMGACERDKVMTLQSRSTVHVPRTRLTPLNLDSTVAPRPPPTTGPLGPHASPGDPPMVGRRDNFALSKPFPETPIDPPKERAERAFESLIRSIPTPLRVSARSRCMLRASSIPEPDSCGQPTPAASSRKSREQTQAEEAGKKEVTLELLTLGFQAREVSSALCVVGASASRAAAFILDAQLQETSSTGLRFNDGSASLGISRDIPLEPHANPPRTDRLVRNLPEEPTLKLSPPVYPADLSVPREPAVHGMPSLLPRPFGDRAKPAIVTAIANVLAERESIKGAAVDKRVALGGAPPRRKAAACGGA